ncbi:olfactomedin-like protein 1 [Tachyglossus aculeatus]|uniref:olfactomedin-like protein 1 n=1 Tax=Tachyglossus aculeatus TaxID=9261 RepID=UPI0018F5FE14|nr:olfactomedin-like protein 1 [Tachyglossus aculeatus]
MALPGLGFCFVLLLASVIPPSQYAQDTALIQYINRRFLILEQGLAKCHQDTQEYIQEFQDFSKKVSFLLGRCGIYKTEYKKELDHLLSRVERAHREIEYIESTRDSPTCIEEDDKIVAQQLIKQAEEEQRVKLLLNASCDVMLVGVKSLKVVKKSGEPQGSWLKDPRGDHQKVYLLSGSDNNTVLEFPNMRAFMESGPKPAFRRLVLPVSWRGTGHAVYGGFLFFLSDGPVNEIVKLSLRKRSVVDRMLLPWAVTLVDLAVDEHGLWAIHAEPDTRANMVLTKLDPESLSAEGSWSTGCSSREVEAVFLVCGVLYTVQGPRAGKPRHVGCVFDVLGSPGSPNAAGLVFPGRWPGRAVIHYDPREKQLFAWHDGSQVVYRLLMGPKAHGG